MYPSRSRQSPLFDADDLLLYAASPFAFWMERCHSQLEASGPAPDPGSEPPPSLPVSQAALRDELQGTVRVVDWSAPESERRLATLEAMRAGVDWILDAQLANESFSTACNLLRRDAASGMELCYIPCVTQDMPTQAARVHLSLQADLLSDVLGEPPRELQLVREGTVKQLWSSATWLPLFRAFRDRFLREQAAFDPNRPPDPSLGLEYGRWAQQAPLWLQRDQEPPGAHSPAAGQERPPVAASAVVVSPIVAGPPDDDVPLPVMIPGQARPGAGQGHPLDTPGFNVLQTRRGRRERGRTGEPAFSSTLNTRDSADD